MIGTKEFLGSLSLLQTFVIGLILDGPALTTVFEPVSVQVAMDVTREFTFWVMFTSVLDCVYLIFLDLLFDVPANIRAPTALFFAGIVSFLTRSIVTLVAIHFLSSVTMSNDYSTMLYLSCAIPQLLFILIVIPVLLSYQYMHTLREHTRKKRSVDSRPVITQQSTHVLSDRPRSVRRK
tara:strand:+ start:664 stop:1200 length:537 start_codon:yes stop_codon:yes gene_type:complete